MPAHSLHLLVLSMGIYTWHKCATCGPLWGGGPYLTVLSNNAHQVLHKEIKIDEISDHTNSTGCKTIELPRTYAVIAVNQRGQSELNCQRLDSTSRFSPPRLGSQAEEENGARV